MDNNSNEWMGGKIAGTLAFQEYPENSGLGYWIVVFRSKQTKYQSKCFTCSKLGGKEAAREVALAWQTEVSNRLGLTKNRYRFIDNYAEVQLTRGYTMKVDRDDIPFVEGQFWCVKTSGGMKDHFYACCCKGTFHKLLTRFDMVDHINRDTFDNRRQNLCDATVLSNSHNRKRSRNNTSGKGGVFKSDGRWIARWCEGGGRSQKGYSIQKYGDEKAKRKAFKKRERECKRLKINND